MTELAIPLMALGGWYVVANYDKDKGKPPSSGGNSAGGNSAGGNSAGGNIAGGSAITRSSGSATNRHMSLTGEPIQSNDFKHNNMVPFYGSKGGGKAANDNLAESRLDNMQGGGSHTISKREQAPLFSPADNVQLSYGMPNQSDFLQSRMNESTRMANTKPWQEERVAPGLNKGFTTTAGAGFNSGMEARDLLMPKSVDDLRVETNPKNTYELNGHEGPANYHNKASGSVKTQGRVEKHSVDRDYEVGPKRWFTTTGASKAAAARENFQLDETNRQRSTTDYYGASVSGVDGGYTDRNYAESTKQQLSGTDMPVPSAGGRHGTHKGEYGREGYNLLSNNRTLDGGKTEVGQVWGMMRAVIAPFDDVFRASRKELLIDNHRVAGNPGAPVTKTTTRGNDKVKPTIRQMTEGGQYGKYLNYQGDQSANGYLNSNPVATSVQRDTTSTEYIGNANSSEWNAPQTYTAAYNQRNSTIKTIPNRPNPGGTQVFQHKVNVRTDKLESDRQNRREIMPNRGTHAIPTMQTQGQVYQPPVQREDDRISSDMLTAFKKNPYTKSLHSF